MEVNTEDTFDIYLCSNSIEFSPFFLVPSFGMQIANSLNNCTSVVSFPFLFVLVKSLLSEAQKDRLDIH